MKHFLVILLLFVASKTYSQTDSPLEKGKIQLNLFMEVTQMSTGVFFGIDYAADKNVTVGLAIGAGDIIPNQYFYGVNIRLDYHFNNLLKMSNKWDVYIGTRADLRYVQINNANYNFDITYRLNVGGRRYFGKHFGIKVELGTNPFQLSSFSSFHYEALGITCRL